MKVPRNEQNRPWIVHGDKVKCYTRASNFANPLKDSLGLATWQNKLILKGVLADPNIGQVARKAGVMKLCTDEEKSEHIQHKVLYAMTERAIEAAGGTWKANMGTALHEATHYVDRGEAVPWELFRKIARYSADIDAYIAGTEGLKTLDAETFIVDDHWKAAGTFDRRVEVAESLMLRYLSTTYTLPPGRYIADIKTGSLDHTPGVFGVQLALYAGGQRYRCLHPIMDPPRKEDCENNIELHIREPLNVNQDVGLLIHLPLGKGECHVYPIDLAFGRKSMEAVEEIKRWRSLKIDDMLYFLTNS